MLKTWKQTSCPLVSGWINKLWHNQTREYHSALKRNKLSCHEEMWRKFKCISLSEGRSQSEKSTYCIIPTILHHGKGKTMETVKNINGSQGLGRESGIIRHRRIYGNETTLYDIIIVDACHYTFVQIRRMYNTKSKP